MYVITTCLLQNNYCNNTCMYAYYYIIVMYACYMIVYIIIMYICNNILLLKYMGHTLHSCVIMIIVLYIFICMHYSFTH